MPNTYNRPLPAVEGSRPVQVTNATSDSAECPVYGEQLDIRTAPTRLTRDVAPAKNRLVRPAANRSGTRRSVRLSVDPVLGLNGRWWSGLPPSAMNQLSPCSRRRH